MTAGRPLLSNAGKVALREFIENNKTKYTRLTDPSLIKTLGEWLSKPEFLNEPEKPLSESQVVNIVSGLAKTLGCSTAYMLEHGIHETQKLPAESETNRTRKRKAESLSEDRAVTNTDDRLRSKTQGEMTANTQRTRTNTEQIADTEEEDSERRPAPRLNESRSQLLPGEAQMIALCRQTRSFWTQSDAPTQGYLEMEMEEIYGACETAIKSLVIDMDYRRLDFTSPPDDCNKLAAMMFNDRRGKGLENALWLMYHKNNLTPELFLRAIAGLSIYSWVLCEDLDIDQSSKLEFKEMLMNCVLQGDSSQCNEDNTSPCKKLEANRQKSIHEYAVNLTIRLQKVLLHFRQSNKLSSFVTVDKRSSLLETYNSSMIDAFERACKLKHALSRSPGDYEKRYAVSGQTFDPRWMTRILNQPCVGEGADVVGICLSPAILGAEAVGSQMYVLCHAQVI